MAVLTDILSSKPALLTFAIPLLLCSLLLLFAGTFLTLDRTRSFVPLADNPDPTEFEVPLPLPVTSSRPGTPIKAPPAIMAGGLPGSLSDWEKLLRGAAPKPTLKKATKSTPTSFLSKANLRKWRFEGGVGGTIAGFVLGLHLTALLALYVSRATSPKLSSTGFLILAFLLSTFLSLLLSRFRLISLLLIACGGGYALALLSSLTFHSSGTASLIIFCVLSVLSLIIPVLSFLPSLDLESVLHWSLRLSTSSLGMAGTLQSIALLGKVAEWDTAQSSLWAANTEIGSGTTTALTVLGWVFILLGTAVDFGIWKLVGASNDEEWDRYLAGYMDNLPDRAGHYEAPTSVWTRLTNIFKEGPGSRKVSNSGRIVGGYPDSDDESEQEKPRFFQRHSPKSNKQRIRRPNPIIRKSNRSVKFDLEPILDDDAFPPPPDPFVGALRKYDPPATHVRIVSPVSSSESTLLGSEREKEWTIEKYEKDITSGKVGPGYGEDDEWKPGFLKRHESMKK